MKRFIAITAVVLSLAALAGDKPTTEATQKDGDMSGMKTGDKKHMGMMAADAGMKDTTDHSGMKHDKKM